MSNAERIAQEFPNEEGPAMTAEYELPNSGVTLRPNPATVGRIVHYTSYPTEHEDKACRAALVTVDEDAEGRVGLRVFHPVASECLTGVEGHHITEDNPADMRSTRGVSGRQPGTWHWPERV